MPGGWSVSSGQTFLYTPEEQRLMHAARAFAQQEILPTSAEAHRRVKEIKAQHAPLGPRRVLDRKSTRLNSSHSQISYAVFCLKKKNNHRDAFTCPPHTPYD